MNKINIACAYHIQLIDMSLSGNAIACEILIPIQTKSTLKKKREEFFLKILFNCH